MSGRTPSSKPSMSVPTADDDFPIEHLQARIERIKMDISLHQKDMVALRTLQFRYRKWPKIFHSFDDELEKTEKTIPELEEHLAYAEKQLAQEIAKQPKPKQR